MITINVFISSPGDTKEERKLIEDVINDWNKSHSKIHSKFNRYDVFLSSKLWEELPPKITSDLTAQEIINEELVEPSHLVIAFFKARAGSPTKSYPSGTVEEIERAIAKGIPTLLYFYGGQYDNNVDTKQLDKLRELKNKYFGQGIVGEYENQNELSNKILDHITKIVSKHFSGNSEEKIYPIARTETVEKKQPKFSCSITITFLSLAFVFLICCVSTIVNYHAVIFKCPNHIVVGNQYNVITRLLPTLDNPPKGIVMLQSCSRGEESYEFSDFRHSVFTRYLVEGLDGKAVDEKYQVVTLTSLASYATEQTKEYVSDNYKKIQHPNLVSDVTDFALRSETPNANSSGRKYAILVGINKYDNLHDLNYPNNDIKALRDALFNIGFEKENIVSVTNDDAAENLSTKDGILSVIDTICKQANKGDVITLFMSGHGFQVADESFFSPSDTNPDNLIETSISINDIGERLNTSEASLKLMVIDACRNDLSSASEK